MDAIALAILSHLKECRLDGRMLELLPIVGDGGLGACLSWDDLEPVLEPHSENELWQEGVTVEAPPRPLRTLDQLEHHGERSPVREAAFRADRAMAHRGKRALDRGRGSQLRRKTLSPSSAAQDLTRKRQQVNSFLLRHGRTYPRKKTWGATHARWLTEQVFAVGNHELGRHVEPCCAEPR